MAFDFSLYNPETWENFCDHCYSMSYGQEANWQKVPAKYKGDCGIEGYLRQGEIVYQCYYPDDNTPKIYYEKLRTKMHNDLEKLIKNKDRLTSIGLDKKIKEWHFVIPEYKDKQILEYRTKKQEKIRQLKLEHIDPNFIIVLKTYTNFDDIVKLKTSLMLSNKLKEKSFIGKYENVDYFSMDNNVKVQNVKRKCLVLNKNFNEPEYLEAYKNLVNTFMNYYVKGIIILKNLQKQEKLVYEAINESASSYKEEAITKASLNAGQISPEVLDEITDEFEEELRKTFKDIIDDIFIKRMSTYIVSSWIADCSLNFIN